MIIGISEDFASCSIAQLLDVMQRKPHSKLLNTEKEIPQDLFLGEDSCLCKAKAAASALSAWFRKCLIVLRCPEISFCLIHDDPLVKKLLSGPGFSGTEPFPYCTRESNSVFRIPLQGQR